MATQECDGKGGQAQAEPEVTITFDEAMAMGKRSYERMEPWRQEAVSRYLDSAQHLQPDLESGVTEDQNPAEGAVAMEPTEPAVITRWEVTRCRLVDHSSMLLMDRLLGDGWQPFAVTENSSCYTYHFRRRVQDAG